jgi:hypothetical protein
VVGVDLVVVRVCHADAVGELLVLLACVVLRVVGYEGGRAVVGQARVVAVVARRVEMRVGGGDVVRVVAAVV